MIYDIHNFIGTIFQLDKLKESYVVFHAFSANHDIIILYVL